MNLPLVDPIVKSLLYEGYLLYPYRASAVKNRLRFNFGVVYPKAFAEAGSDAWVMETQCLATASPSAKIEICVRFLRIVDRFDTNSSLESWQEAVECRVDLPTCSLGENLRHEFFLPPEYEGGPGAIRIRSAIRGVVEVSSQSVSEAASRISVRILNITELPDGSQTQRESASSHALISTHTILEISGGEFVSLLDPPEPLREAAAACKNTGTWPVLVGAAEETNAILSSPIILYDYPSVAPESPGDLCDSTEIDEILTLRVLTLTEEEKQEARRTDEYARRILDRAESLDSEQFSKLHGAFRGTR